MRSFVVSILIIAVIIAVSLLNSGYVESKSRELLETANSLPSSVKELRLCDRAETEEKINALERKWKECSPKIDLTVPYPESEKLTLALINMKIFFESESYDLFLSSRALFLDAAEKLSKIENYSFENIT